MAGLTLTGLDIPTLNEEIDKIKADLIAVQGPGLNLLPTSVLGSQLIILAERYVDLWEALQDLYDGLDPDAASGVLLRYMAALQGLTPLPATYSTVTLTVNLDAATTLTAGRLVSSPATGVQFTTTAAVTSTTAGNYSVAAQAVTTGPVAALAGSLTQIDTPVTGWNSVTNALDADPGTNAETDAELRIRRAATVAAAGSTTPDAIRADTAAITGILSVKLLENRTNSTDGNGLPPHSFEVIFDDGGGTVTDDAMAQAIWDDSKAAGIETYGTDSGTAVDSEGNNQTINFSRVSAVNAYASVTLTTDPLTYPGDAAVAAEIGAHVLLPGETLYASKIYDLAFNIPGVLDVTATAVDTDGPPVVGTSITATARQNIKMDSSRVTVVSS